MILKLLGALIRLLLLMATLVTVAAIGIGNANPEGPPRRVASPPSYQVLDQAITALHGGGSLIVHLESGRLESLPLPPGVGIDKASLSPWEEDGRRQIVGVGWKPIRGRGIVVKQRLWPHTHEPPRWRDPRPIDPAGRGLAGGRALLDPGRPGQCPLCGGRLPSLPRRLRVVPPRRRHSRTRPTPGRAP